MSEQKDPAYDFGASSRNDREQSLDKPKKPMKNVKSQANLPAEMKQYRPVMTQTVWPRKEFDQTNQEQRNLTTTTTPPNQDRFDLTRPGRVGRSRSPETIPSRGDNTDRSRSSPARRPTNQQRGDSPARERQDPTEYPKDRADTRRSPDRKPVRDDDRSRTPPPRRPTNMELRDSPVHKRQDSAEYRKEPADTRRSPKRERTRSQHADRSRSSSPRKPIDQQRRDSPQRQRQDRAHSRRSPGRIPSRCEDGTRSRSSSPRKPVNQQRHDSPPHERQDPAEYRKDRADTRRSPKRERTRSQHADRSRSSSPRKPMNQHRHESPERQRQDRAEYRKDRSDTRRSPDRKPNKDDHADRSRSSSPRRPTNQQRRESPVRERQDTTEYRKDRADTRLSAERKRTRSQHADRSRSSSPRKPSDQQRQRRDDDYRSPLRRESPRRERQSLREDRMGGTNSRTSPEKITTKSKKDSSPSPPGRKGYPRRDRSPSDEPQRGHPSRDQKYPSDGRKSTGYSPVKRSPVSRLDSSDRRRHESVYDHRREPSSSSEDVRRQDYSRERAHSSSKKKSSKSPSRRISSNDEVDPSTTVKKDQQRDHSSPTGRGRADSSRGKRKEPSITPIRSRRPTDSGRNGRNDSRTTNITPLRPSPSPRQDKSRRTPPIYPPSTEKYSPIIPNDDSPISPTITARRPETSSAANLEGVTILLNIGIQTDPKLVSDYETGAKINIDPIRGSSSFDQNRERAHSETVGNQSSSQHKHENVYESMQPTRVPPSSHIQYTLRPSNINDSRYDTSSRTQPNSNRNSSRIEERIPVHQIDNTSVHPDPPRREQRTTPTSVSRQSNQFNDLPEQNQIGSNEMINITSSIPSRSVSQLDRQKLDDQIPVAHSGDFQTPSRISKPLHHATESRISPSVNKDFAVPFESYGPAPTNRNFEPVNNDGTANSRTLLLPVLNSSRTYVVEKSRLTPTSPLRQSRSNGNFYFGHRTSDPQDEKEE